ncbi:MAG TPA: gas vesicle protein K [Vicinamibacterales bacterium]|nr:gas vesicle protein K [Vicinamibacterales bacterium]
MADFDDVKALEMMAAELKDRLEQRSGGPARWNANPEDVRKSVMQLVLTLVDFIRQVMERQALRRVDEGTLTPDEIERIGLALMHLEQTVHDLATQVGLDPKDLNLDLGPLGKLT